VLTAMSLGSSASYGVACCSRSRVATQCFPAPALPCLPISPGPTSRGKSPVTDTASHLFSGPPAYVPRTPWRAGWALLATLLISIAGILTLSGLLSIDKVVRGLGRAQGLW